MSKRGHSQPSTDYYNLNMVSRRKRRKMLESFNVQNVKLEKMDLTLVPTVQFEDLPNEIILKVLSNLTKTRDLIRCGRISKRIRELCLDETIWKTFIFIYKSVPTDFLNLVVNKGCENLRLHCVKIGGDSLNLMNPSRLKCLDLTYCRAKVGVLREILSSCKNVEKLFLSYTYDDVTGSNVCHLVQHLVKLKEFGLRHKAEFSEESFEHLVNNLSTRIEKLGLAFPRLAQFDVDKHIKTLVSRCKNLTALSLLDIQITDNTLDSLIEHLKPTLVEFCTNSPRIRLAVKVQNLLTSMQKLKILKINEMGSWGHGMTTEDIKKLQRQYPEKRINHDYNLIGAYMDPDQEFGTLKQAVERPKAANFVIHDERKWSKMVKNQGIEIRYSAHSSFTLTSLLIFKNLSKLVLLRDEMPCR